MGTDISSTPPEVAQVARPTRHSAIRTDLNRWVAISSGVISTVAVLSSWGEPQFSILVALWVLHGLAGAVLGHHWKREGVDHRRMTFPSQGLDERLTGVEPAQVVRGILS